MTTATFTEKQRQGIEAMAGGHTDVRSRRCSAARPRAGAASMNFLLTVGDFQRVNVMRQSLSSV